MVTTCHYCEPGASNIKANKNKKKIAFRWTKTTNCCTYRIHPLSLYVGFWLFLNIHKFCSISISESESCVYSAPRVGWHFKDVLCYLWHFGYLCYLNNLCYFMSIIFLFIFSLVVCQWQGIWGYLGQFSMFPRAVDFNMYHK